LGLEERFKDGFLEEGFEDGLEEGFKDGLEDGVIDGLEEGFEDGSNGGLLLGVALEAPQRVSRRQR
jgi:flagellar biosynthesis/type III secretory pathway protein FliH